MAPAFKAEMGRIRLEMSYFTLAPGQQPFSHAHYCADSQRQRFARREFIYRFQGGDRRIVHAAHDIAKAHYA